MKRYSLGLAMLLTITCILGSMFVATGSIAHASTLDDSDPCGTNGKFYIPNQTFGPFYNGHSSYYAYLSGYQCGATSSSGGQFGQGTQYYEAHTDSSLSIGQGYAVYQTEAYGQAFESCNGSGYGVNNSIGGWSNGNSADTGVFSMSLANCQTGHDYFLKAFHYQKVHSTDNPEGETKCSEDSGILSGCPA